MMKKETTAQQKIYQSVYVTLSDTNISVYKDRLTYEYKQDPNITVNLEDVVRVQIYKYVPGADA